MTKHDIIKKKKQELHCKSTRWNYISSYQTDSRAKSNKHLTTNDVNNITALVNITVTSLWAGWSNLTFRLCQSDPLRSQNCHAWLWGGNNRNPVTRGGSFVSKVGQINPWANGTIQGGFQIRFQFILTRQANTYWNLIWMCPGFVPFVATDPLLNKTWRLCKWQRNGCCWFLI